MHRRAIAVLVLVGVESLGLGCGGAGEARPRSPNATVSTRAGAVPSDGDAKPRGMVLRRTSVQAAVKRGLGAFLQNVTLEERPVFEAGRFHGFRIATLRGDMWNGVDLRAGDVITSVNGFAIERPEQAQNALQSLEVSSELQVGYERDGVPKTLRYAIVDE